MLFVFSVVNPFACLLCALCVSAVNSSWNPANATRPRPHQQPSPSLVSRADRGDRATVARARDRDGRTDPAAKLAGATAVAAVGAGLRRGTAAAQAARSIGRPAAAAQ